MCQSKQKRYYYKRWEHHDKGCEYHDRQYKYHDIWTWIYGLLHAEEGTMPNIEEQIYMQIERFPKDHQHTPEEQEIIDLWTERYRQYAAANNLDDKDRRSWPYDELNQPNNKPSGNNEKRNILTK
ncbi:hypothetical protein [Tunicatimonas pelagia]|uniref:hypothetical protein n=1 Tax=Tunicatimonas pelagia TaxID=931531 RepID=UPI002664F594|nr:hypothetical protein [Tunicatimonas pelagia]WKN45412.1 hypothetical protein P0M28_10630 [Tunicatimonas pelagia]